MSSNKAFLIWTTRGLKMGQNGHVGHLFSKKWSAPSDSSEKNSLETTSSTISLRRRVLRLLMKNTCPINICNLTNKIEIYKYIGRPVRMPMIGLINIIFAGRPGF